MKCISVKCKICRMKGFQKKCELPTDTYRLKDKVIYRGATAPKKYKTFSINNVK